MSKINTYFENVLKKPKLQVGLTKLRPGPILFIVAATAVKFVVKSKFSIDTKSNDKTNTHVNVA